MWKLRWAIGIFRPWRDNSSLLHLRPRQGNAQDVASSITKENSYMRYTHFHTPELLLLNLHTHELRTRTLPLGKERKKIRESRDRKSGAPVRFKRESWGHIRLSKELLLSNYASGKMRDEMNGSINIGVIFASPSLLSGFLGDSATSYARLSPQPSPHSRMHVHFTSATWMSINYWPPADAVQNMIIPIDSELIIEGKIAAGLIPSHSLRRVRKKNPTIFRRSGYIGRNHVFFAARAGRSGSQLTQSNQTGLAALQWCSRH